MLRVKLSTQERKLYRLIAAGLACALLLGVLAGLMSVGDKGGERADNWQASSLAVIDDTSAQYALVSAPTRWYQDPATAQIQATAEEQQSLAGQPASFTLVGIVEQDGKRVALLVPVAGVSTQSSRKVKSLVEGDVLVGDWVMKTISANQVEIQQGEEARTLKMYQPGTQ